MKLLNDVSRCHNGTCPFRENCLRWILRADAVICRRIPQPGFPRLCGPASSYFEPNATECQHMIRKPQPPKQVNINLIPK